MAGPDGGQEAHRRPRCLVLGVHRMSCRRGRMKEKQEARLSSHPSNVVFRVLFFFSFLSSLLSKVVVVRVCAWGLEQHYTHFRHCAGYLSLGKYLVGLLLVSQDRKEGRRLFLFRSWRAKIRIVSLSRSKFCFPLEMGREAGA